MNSPKGLQPASVAKVEPRKPSVINPMKYLESRMCPIPSDRLEPKF